MISVVVLTYNEEVNIRRCLDSVAWCEDVLIVDSFSTDQTLKIAEEQKVRWIQRAFDDFAGQRNFALDYGNLRNDWVFHLDADEVITPELQIELRRVAQAPEHKAYRVASKLIFDGRWLRYAGLFPWYQVRFGKRGALRFKQVGHGQRETLPPQEIGTLTKAMLHYPFEKGLDDWMEKHERYSTAEAQSNVARAEPNLRWLDLVSRNVDTRRRALKRTFRRLPFRPMLRFLYMYVTRRGILDGRTGLRYCRMLMWYEQMIVQKERLLRRRH